MGVTMKKSNWGQTKGGKIRIMRIKDKKAYFDLLHLKSRSKAKKVKHIINWKIKTKIGKEVVKKKLEVLPLLAGLLLTDGHVYKKKDCWEIGFASKNKQLSYLFSDFIQIWNPKQIISKYIDKNDVTRLYFHLPLQNNLIKLNKSFKTSPRNQSISDYLKEAQPSIRFLYQFNNVYKNIFLRIVFSTDGGITIKEYKNRIRPYLFLRCAHPILCKDYKKIASESSIKLKIVKDKSKWSGIGGLIATNMNSLRNFQKIGGFVNGVKVSRKSKYFFDIEKNWILDKFINNKNEIRKIIYNARLAQLGYKNQKEQLTLQNG